MNGETVASNTTVFSLAEIAPMDKIEGRLVIDAMSIVDRDGNVIGWEVYQMCIRDRLYPASDERQRSQPFGPAQKRGYQPGQHLCGIVRSGFPHGALGLLEGCPVAAGAAVCQRSENYLSRPE